MIGVLLCIWVLIAGIRAKFMRIHTSLVKVTQVFKRIVAEMIFCGYTKFSDRYLILDFFK